MKNILFSLVLFGFVFSASAAERIPYNVNCEPSSIAASSGRYLLEAHIHVWSCTNAKISLILWDSADPTGFIQLQQMETGVFSSVADERNDEVKYLGYWQGGKVKVDLHYLRTERSGDILAGNVDMENGSSFPVVCKLR